MSIITVIIIHLAFTPGDDQLFPKLIEHHALYGRDYPINESLKYNFVIRAAISEIQLFLTLSGKLGLIGYYKLGHIYLTEYPDGLKHCRTTSVCPRIIFGKVDKVHFFCEI